MKNRISINSVIINQYSIEVCYLIEGDCCKYFNIEKGNGFRIEYNENIERVPKNIAVIPFIVNVLPIVWLTDAILEVEELDRTFYNSINRFKQGYIDMYPMMNFKGSIKVKCLIENNEEPIGKVAVFFSGGVDAFASLIAHVDESPILLTLWGSDIKIDDQLGWNNVRKHVDETAMMFGLEKIYIKTNFRTFINEGMLNLLVVQSGDSWWHGFQHGIGLIGHAAPLAFNLKLKTVYIASSYTKDDDVTCASSPTIDNNVEYACCKVVHDQYEFHRQEKITHICNYIKKNHKKIVLRVCWQSSGGENCCNCEKCYRTIFGIIAEGESPSQYGFKNVENKIGTIGSRIQKRLIMNPMICIPYWQDIQDRFIENKDNIPQRSDLEWIYDFDFNKINNTIPKKILLLAAKCRKIASKIKLYILR